MAAALHITVGPALAALTPEQESLARSIEGKVMAPCCWTQTVADHQSDIAEQMKAEIRNLIAQGRSEEEILDQYVDRYGPAILATPRADGFDLLAYVLPVAAAVAGAIIITLWLMKRSRLSTPDGEREGTALDKGSTSPGLQDRSLRTRLDDELSEFDG